MKSSTRPTGAYLALVDGAAEMDFSLNWLMTLGFGVEDEGDSEGDALGFSPSAAESSVCKVSLACELLERTNDERTVESVSSILDLC